MSLELDGSDELGTLLRRAVQIADAVYARASFLSNVTPSQRLILKALVASRGMSQADLVQCTNIDRSTVAVLVRTLTGRKLVERTRSRTDNRAFVVKVTSAGRAALEKSNGPTQAVERELRAALPEGDRDAMLRGLRAVVALGDG